jgi:hypothetical protein
MVSEGDYDRELFRAKKFDSFGIVAFGASNRLLSPNRCDIPKVVD